MINPGSDVRLVARCKMNAGIPLALASLGPALRFGSDSSITMTWLKALLLLATCFQCLQHSVASLPGHPEPQSLVAARPVSLKGSGLVMSSALRR